MNEANSICQKVTNTEAPPAPLSCSDSTPVQRLLAVVVAIIAEEYIQMVKKHPEAFIDRFEASGPETMASFPPTLEPPKRSGNDE